MSILRDAALTVGQAVVAQKDYLTMLDTKTGDGDHGLNMARGWNAAMEEVERLPQSASLADVLRTIGEAIRDNVGGASGPLYSTGFLHAAKACNGTEKMNSETFAKLFGAAVEAICKRGRSKRGDKTMLDTLIPLYEEFLPQQAAGRDFSMTLAYASRAAKDGMDFTKTLEAKRGRASYLGKKTIGCIDPGAASSQIMFRALYEFLTQ